MPNWCENKMTIKHQDPLMIKRARDAWMSGQFLNEFIPIPKDLEIVSGRVGADDNPDQVKLVAMGLDITNYYYEPGMGFCGVFKDGADTTYGTGQAPEEIQEQFGFDVPVIELTRQELIDKLLNDDVSNWSNIEDLKNYVEHTAMNGVTGYKDMTEDQLKEEYISRGLHEEE